MSNRESEVGSGQAKVQDVRVAYIEKYVEGVRHLFLMKFAPGDENQAVSAVSDWCLNPEVPLSRAEGNMLLINILNPPPAPMNVVFP